MCRPSRGITGSSKMKETLRSPNQTVKQESRQKPVDTLASVFFVFYLKTNQILEHFEMINMWHKQAKGIKGEAALFTYEKGTTQKINASFLTTWRKSG